MKTPSALHRPATRSAHGFSLIETLVAIVIFALMMMGTIPLFVRSTADVARNRNLLHYNNGMQALMDELTTRNAISSTDAMVTTGNHIYNSAIQTAPVPSAVAQLFSGNATSDRVLQNNLLAQVQYVISVDGVRKRADVVVYYYTSNRYVSPYTGTGTLTYSAARVLHMSSVAASGYIDTPSKIL
jgi:prepilin-type N-terminal cleavage/methylation domain-containing protein